LGKFNKIILNWKGWHSWFWYILEPFFVDIFEKQNTEVSNLQGLYFRAEGYFSQKVRNLNDFTVFASSKKSSIYLLINEYFTYIIYDTSSWGLELTPKLHSTNLLHTFFQIELRFSKKSTKIYSKFCFKVHYFGQ
jgi:hypothetical protein